MRAVVVAPDAPACLALGDVAEPQPAANEALVQVATVSINRGEVRRAQSAAAGARIGWDLAGTVEQAAADGSGPKAGSRVVGFMSLGAWSERVAVPTDGLALMPDGVSFAQACTLPVAGLTALLALEKNGSVLGRNVLITGATGGVGNFAVQLARDAGAFVVGQVRDPKQVAEIKSLGAHEVAVGENIAHAAEFGPFHIIVDGVGGTTLASAMPLLAQDGMAACYGATGGATISIDLTKFYPVGGASLFGFILFHELRRIPASVGLARLVRRLDAGTLKPTISVEADWNEVGTIAQRLMDREFSGKAVLRIG